MEGGGGGGGEKEKGWMVLYGPNRWKCETQRTKRGRGPGFRIQL